MQYVSVVTTVISLIFCVLTFFFNRNSDTKKDSKDEREEAKATQYKWGVMETKLDNLSKQVDKILDKLDSYDKEFDDKIKAAIAEHEKRFHDKWGLKMSFKDRVIEMKEEIENLKKENQENTLAMDLLKELKVQNKRQHITIIVLICVIVAMIIGFFIFANQFEVIGEESTQETYYTENSEITQTMQ